MAASLSACISPNSGHWGKSVEGAGFPSMSRISQAAKTAAVDPQTWVPLLAAGVIAAADVDEDWSEDLAEDQPLFGDDAEDRSDDLRDIATASYIITALAAPSESFGGKVRGLSVGAGTMILDGVVSRGLKDLTQRERPDRSNDNSMPSGHASKAASRTNMAIRNLDYMDLAPWQKNTVTWALHGVAIGTGLARVEAEKHYLSDVLVGYAVGQFLSSFMYEAFMADAETGASLSAVPVADGLAFRLTIPLK